MIILNIILAIAGTWLLWDIHGWQTAIGILCMAVYVRSPAAMVRLRIH